jgi:hypothetical protein
METGSDRGNHGRPELAAVSGAVPYEPEQPSDACVRACPSVRLPVPMVAALRPGFDHGVNRHRRPERHEALRGPMERRQGGGNDRRADLAAISRAVPYAPRLRRAVGRFCSGPSPRARLSVGLSVPLVAVIAPSFGAGRALNPPSG